MNKIELVLTLIMIAYSVTLNGIYIFCQLIKINSAKSGIIVQVIWYRPIKSNKKIKQITIFSPMTCY